MDYGRLFLFMAAATAVMALATHLWCAIYWVVERTVIRRAVARQMRLDLEVDERRARMVPYMTHEQLREDLLGAATIDHILDRVNGKWPPKAADIQGLGGPSSGPDFPPSTVLIIGCGLALLGALGGFKISKEAWGELLKFTAQKPPSPPTAL